MHKQGNATTAATRPVTWPTADELRGVVADAGRLLEPIERFDWRLRPIYEAADDGQEPTLEELGALAWFVSAIESDLESISEREPCSCS